MNLEQWAALGSVIVTILVSAVSVVWVLAWKFGRIEECLSNLDEHMTQHAEHLNKIDQDITNLRERTARIEEQK